MPTGHSRDPLVHRTTTSRRLLLRGTSSTRHAAGSPRGRGVRPSCRRSGLATKVFRCKARAMADAATLRQNVEDLLTRVLAGGETDLTERLVHPDFVNQEAA